MKHSKKASALRRQVLLCALALAFILPLVCCIFLTVRQSRMRTQLRQAQDEIARLRTAAQQVEQPPEETDSSPVSGNSPADAAPEYQSLFPDLYCQPPEEAPSVTENVCYLTFDDGPSEQTPAILDTLDKLGVKATFFVVGSSVQKYPEIVKDAVQRGHTIGVHTNSHSYKEIYASPEAYLTDFYAVWKSVYDLTGVKANVFRFPGGSINQYNKGIYQPLIAEMLRRGFAYYDWNASAEDAVGKPTVQSVVENALNTKAKMPIVLMHDSTYTTATAQGLAQIIEGFRGRGYSFGTLSPEVYSVAFGYKD